MLYPEAARVCFKRVLALTPLAYDITGQRDTVKQLREFCCHVVLICPGSNMNFSRRNAVVSMNEIYPLEKAQEAYERMLSGKARFRVVLKMDA